MDTEGHFCKDCWCEYEHGCVCGWCFLDLEDEYEGEGD